MGRKEALLVPFLKKALRNNLYRNILRFDTDGVVLLDLPRKNNHLTYEDEQLLKDYELTRGRLYGGRNCYTRVKQSIMQSVKKSSFLHHHPKRKSSVCFTFKSNEEIKATQSHRKTGQMSNCKDTDSQVFNYENDFGSPLSDASSGYVTGTEEADLTDTFDSNKNIFLSANQHKADPPIQESSEVNDMEESRPIPPELLSDIKIPETIYSLLENWENVCPVINGNLNNLPLNEFHYPSTSIPHESAELFQDMNGYSNNLPSDKPNCSSSIPHESTTISNVMEINEMDPFTYSAGLKSPIALELNHSVENGLSHSGIDENKQEIIVKKCWVANKIIEIHDGLLQLVCSPRENEKILHMQQGLLKDDFPEITVSDEMAGKLCGFVAVNHSIVEQNLFVFLKVKN